MDDDLRVKSFFAEGSAFAMRQFVVGALNNEMGLEAADPDLLAASQGARVVTPAGMVLDGGIEHLDPPPVATASEDGDDDGVVDEIDPALVDYLEFYLLNYFRPGRYEPYPSASRKGLRDFEEIGCASCHIPDLEIERDRRVADVGAGDRAGASRLRRPVLHGCSTVRAGGGARAGLPPLRRASERRFRVRGIFADFKRHDLGPNFSERSFDGTFQHEFMTEPLWGVATTAPYGHDGRSINLREVILRHGGEAQEKPRPFRRPLG